MKKLISVVVFTIFLNAFVFAQPVNTIHTGDFVDQKINVATSVKNQATTGTCWCFSSTSLLESACLQNKMSNVDLSEMFTVRNIYIEKAGIYLLRQGHTQFSEGGLGHDAIRAISTYGAMPESAYSGLLEGQKAFNHTKLIAELKTYLDSILKTSPLPENWMTGYKKILNENMGTPPEEFEYMGNRYTPKSFAIQLLHFNEEDYVNLTSFTHHPFYQPFIVEVPDNFSNGSYYNIPLAELTSVAEEAINKGFSLLWDADVSNNGFKQDKGLALFLNQQHQYVPEDYTADMPEQPYNSNLRQQLFMNLTTQDDHLMHLIGMEKSKGGKTFFVVKNSWGEVGPYKGYINVSESYFAMNTISLIVPKAAINKSLLEKLNIK